MSYTGRPGMGRQFYKILRICVFYHYKIFAQATYRCNLDYKRMFLGMVESVCRMCITATLPKIPQVVRHVNLRNNP